jgi:hypothetical protein
MFEQKWPKGKGKGRPRADGKKTGDMVNDPEVLQLLNLRNDTYFLFD